MSEPMLGADRPTLWGDVYFAMYTLAMSTGKTRSPDQVSGFIKDAGFSMSRFINQHGPSLQP